MNQEVAVEATITSKGQVTLPKVLRSHLGLRTGSRVRFSLPPQGGFQGHRVLHELEDLWEMADAAQKRAGKQNETMTLEEMDEAKALRVW
jgi:AbrB family looped-hinge helix DNA binding protein